MKAWIPRAIRIWFRVFLVIWSAGLLLVAGLFWKIGAFYVGWGKNPPRGRLVTVSTHPIEFFSTIAIMVALAVVGFAAAVLLPIGRS